MDCPFKKLTLKGFIKQIVDYRYAIYQVFRQSLIEMYSRSFLGIFWLIIIPLSKMLLFIFLARVKVIAVQNTAFPYPLYVFYGLIVWQTFSDSMRNSCNILTRYNSLKTGDFPRDILIYGKTCIPLLNALLMLVLFYPVSLLYGVPPSSRIVYLPFVFLCVVLFALGLSKIVAILNVISRDLAEILSLLLLFWMFATPIIYSASTRSFMFIKYINPLYNFIEVAHFLWTGEISKITAIFYWHCILAFMVFLVGTYFFHRSIYTAMERV